MQAHMRSHTAQSAADRARLRLPLNLVGRRRGRARISAATSTAVPRCLASTSHRTRVSEMRRLPSRSKCERSQLIVTLPGTLTSERRDPGSPRHLSG
jgi:hypothetical protein